MKEMEKAMNEFKNGRKSEKETVNVILTVIFKNRKYFRLDKLDEDNFSDYLLYLSERLPHFMKLYNPEIGQFSTYLRKLCMTELRSWYRVFYRKYAREVALSSYAVEENLCTREIEDPEEEFLSSTEQTEMNSFMKFLLNTNRKVPIQTKIMMLALKSAFFLTPFHIKRICKIADISEAELYEKLDCINSKLDKKIERQRHLLQLQNAAYIIRKESDIQMSFLNPESSHFHNAGISRDYHDKLWKSRMERSRKSHDVYPTNSLISEVLDVPIGQVTHVLSAVHHKMDGSNTQKEVSYEYDNLRSYRKPSQTKRTPGNTESTSDTDSKR
ncbi:MAG: hypothetical protein KBT02_03130 [Treponema sp.]|nr:hypothetical protein [Candidatus Treponema caballi]